MDIINEINNQTDELNLKITDKFHKCYNYYNDLSLKFILTVEKTIYKILFNEKMNNLNNDTCFIMINDFLNGLFTSCLNTQISNVFKENFNNIQKYISDSNLVILKKTFKIIDAFYSCIDRSKLNCKTIDLFVKSIYEMFNQYYHKFEIEILNLIKDSKFNDPVSFKLTEINN